MCHIVLVSRHSFWHRLTIARVSAEMEGLAPTLEIEIRGIIVKTELHQSCFLKVMTGTKRRTRWLNCHNFPYDVHGLRRHWVRLCHFHMFSSDSNSLLSRRACFYRPVMSSILKRLGGVREHWLTEHEKWEAQGP